MKFLISIAFVLIITSTTVHCRGQCVTLGQCEEDPLTALKRPCVYNGPPKPLHDSPAAETLRTLCPTLDMGPDSTVCCDSDQVRAFRNSMYALATLFEKCPSCYHNLANVFCQLTCSPKQSQFLKVTESSKSEGKESVSKMSYHITETYARGLFDSCNNVKLSNTPQKVMDIACGSHFSDCTPHLWLQYMGGHDPSPYEIDFQFELEDVDGTTFVPMNETIVPCSQAVAGSVACSRADCPRR